jgi:hypothetical protein
MLLLDNVLTSFMGGDELCTGALSSSQRCARIHCRPPQTSGAAEQAVNSVHLNPQNVDQIFVCTRAPTIVLMTLQGQVRDGLPMCSTSV